MPSYRIVFVSPSEFARRLAGGAVLYRGYAVEGFERFGAGVAYATEPVRKFTPPRYDAEYYEAMDKLDSM